MKTCCASAIVEQEQESRIIHRMLTTGMASQDKDQNGFSLAGAIAWIHKYFLWLLVSCYVLAVIFPEPAGAIRALSFGKSAGSDVTAPMLLLAILLFCAASVVQWSQVRNLLQKPTILLLSAVVVWAVPAMFVILLGGLLPNLVGPSLSGGLLVGLVLVAAMPVANSSVAWTQDARGNVALGLGLIILTILLSPVATPRMLQLMGLMLSAEEAQHCEAMVAQFTGTFFIIWVILPSAAGLLFNRIVGSERIEQNRGIIRLVSAGALLLLNYANASLLVSHELDFFSSESAQAIALAVVLAISISALGLASAAVARRWFSLERASGISLAFAFCMKHNGLALTLAGKVLHTQPRAILMIICGILMQHVVAGMAGRWLEHKRLQDESDGDSIQKPSG